MSSFLLFDARLLAKDTSHNRKIRRLDLRLLRGRRALTGHAINLQVLAWILVGAVDSLNPPCDSSKMHINIAPSSRTQKMNR
jgi:hypothetical protein